jgi:hypothetical protein
MNKECVYECNTIGDEKTQPLHSTFSHSLMFVFLFSPHHGSLMLIHPVVSTRLIVTRLFMDISSSCILTANYSMENFLISFLCLF